MLLAAVVAYDDETGFRGRADFLQFPSDDQIAGRTVLVIDDVGLIRLKSAAEAAWFFEVVNTRYEKGHPTLVTTNRGLPDWGEIFGDTVVAAAILDRLMHNAVVLNIRGPSWRLREHDSLQIATTQPTERSTS